MEKITTRGDSREEINIKSEYCVAKSALPTLGGLTPVDFRCSFDLNFVTGSIFRAGLINGHL